MAITNLQAVFKGGGAPGDNIMIYEVDVPTVVDPQALARDLRTQAEALKLEITHPAPQHLRDSPPHMKRALPG